MDEVAVRRDVEYGQGLTFDLYDPGTRAPAVVIVARYPDPGFEKMLGCKVKDIGSSNSWGRLLASSGISGITSTNPEPDADLHAPVAHVPTHSEELWVGMG